MLLSDYVGLESGYCEHHDTYHHYYDLYRSSPTPKMRLSRQAIKKHSRLTAKELERRNPLRRQRQLRRLRGYISPLLIKLLVNVHGGKHAST
jgi:hypothetical protein